MPVMATVVVVVIASNIALVVAVGCLGDALLKSGFDS
jgi:hypothetical protein